MLRRLSDRARLEGILALRKALDTVRRDRDTMQSPQELARTPRAAPRENDESTWYERADSDRVDQLRVRADLDSFDLDARDYPHARTPEQDPELSKAMNAIVDAIDRMAAQLDSYHQEHAEHLDAIEFLLRELVISSVPSSGTRSIVLGGVIDASEKPTVDSDISLVGDGALLDVGCSVEVRSRFHDRWICGFSVAEVVEAPGRIRYRLTRRSDGIPTPDPVRGLRHTGRRMHSIGNARRADSPNA